MDKYDYGIEEDYASAVYKYSQTRGWKPAFPTQANTKDPLKARFKVGDSVRLKNGTAEIEVTEVTFSQYRYEWTLSGKYVNSDNYVTQRNQNDFVLYDGEKKMTDTTKLYVFKNPNSTSDVDLYGHYLATNSQGEWVMEVKGSGQIIAVAKDKVEEVLPYTISVKFNDSGTTYSYLSEKDKFSVGFYLVKAMSFDGWQIAQVTAVDTKSNKATKEFAPIGKLAVDLF